MSTRIINQTPRNNDWNNLVLLMIEDGYQHYLQMVLIEDFF